jgi:hypothetical protein
VYFQNERAISEAKKFREEYARSCALDNGDKTLQGVGDNQGMAIMTFQMNILQRKATRAEQELKDIKDKHEQELRHERDLNTQKEKIIEQERLKNEQLKEELRIFEENVLQGIMSNESKIKTKSHNESPDSPKHKRIKMGEERSKDNLDLKDNSSEEIIRIKQEAPQDDKKDLKIVPIFIDENDKMHYESTAYTTSIHDKSNILIAKKDPQSLRSAADTLSETARPKALGAHLIKHQPRLPTKEEI